MKLDDLDNYIALLIPKQQDPYTQDLRDFFYTILNLQDSEFIGFSIQKDQSHCLLMIRLKRFLTATKARPPRQATRSKRLLAVLS